MSNYTVMNILDLTESVGEDEVKKGLSSFSCPLNKECHSNSDGIRYLQMVRFF